MSADKVLFFSLLDKRYKYIVVFLFIYRIVFFIYLLFSSAVYLFLKTMVAIYI